MEKSGFSDFIAAIENISDIDVRFAIGNMGGSLSLYKQILKKAVSLIPRNIEEMDREFDANQTSTFGVKAHGMKGAFNQVGCFRLARLAEMLEKAAKDQDTAYCNANYGKFKKEALAFYDQMNLLFQDEQTGGATKAEHMPQGQIGDFADVVAQAKAAAAGFDSVLAAKCLSSLTQYHFGKNTDLLVRQALEELEAFRPRKATPYIDSLIVRCENHGEKDEEDNNNKNNENNNRKGGKIYGE